MYRILKNAGKLLAITLIATACNQDSKTNNTTATAKPDSAAAVKPAAPVVTGHLVGVWHDEAIKTDKGEQIAYEVVTDGKKIFIQAITFTGTDLKVNDTPPISASATEIKKQGDKFVSVERPTETYKVDKKGNLLLYDKGELVAVCKKIL